MVGKPLDHTENQPASDIHIGGSGQDIINTNDKCIPCVINKLSMEKSSLSKDRNGWPKPKSVFTSMPRDTIKHLLQSNYKILHITV